MKFTILSLSNPGIWLGSVGEFDSCRHCCDLSGRGWTVPEIGQRDYCVFVGPGLFCLEENNGWISSPFWRVIRKVCFRSKGRRASNLAQRLLSSLPCFFLSCHLPRSAGEQDGPHSQWEQLQTPFPEMLLLDPSFFLVALAQLLWSWDGVSQPGTADILGWVILCCGATLCKVGCLQHPWPLPIGYQLWIPFPRCDNQKCLLKLPNVSWEAQLSLLENHWSSVIGI